MTRSVIIAIIAVIVVIGIAWLFDIELFNTRDETGAPTLQEPAPIERAGVTYVNASSDDIRVTEPVAGARVPRTFTVSGVARGPWYFEANFPIEVIDPAGTSLVVTPVTAQGEWMTTDLVPFSVSITVPGTYTGPARLVLHRDNASGLPEHDKSLSIPIVIE